MQKRRRTSSSCIALFLCTVLLSLILPRCVSCAGTDKTVVNKEEYLSAIINATVQDSKGNTKRVISKEDGRYGQNSPKTEVTGIIITPSAVNGVVDMQGCCTNTRFIIPPKTTHWIALLQRGKCMFKEKILKAAAFNASAVLIYNNSSKEDTVTMAHEGTGDTVAVMITESLGKDLLYFVEKNETVWVSVSVGSRGPVKNLNRGSLVFVSISFIVLMIISSAWLIFYFIQKIRDTNARDRSQRRLGDAAKKAISKLTTRTVKRGDKETEPDFNHCAVCIEGYQLNDVVRILPCKHVFHKMCVDPWLNEHCTCPMCKLNILKALGIMPNLQCVDNVAFDMERMTRTHSSSQRVALMDVSSETSVSVEPLTRSGSSQLLSESELTHTHTHRSGEINIAVTKEWFIVGSFAVLSVLTLCYMIIRATGNNNDNTAVLMFKVAHGALTDFSEELLNTKGEMFDLYLRAHPEKVPRYKPSQHGHFGASSYPRKFDWRDRRAVGPVHNQKSVSVSKQEVMSSICGGCWAFSVVSAVESVRVKDGGKFQELSVQQVIDCAYKSQGCDGGSPVSTLAWLKQSGEKLVNETEYPYEEKTGVCQVFPWGHGGVSVKDYAAFDFSGQEEEMSRRLVEWGPLVVIVDAVSWQDYQGGVIQHHCSAEHANHAVIITGYDTTGEVPFWIVRNSWGTSWGDEGYAYIKMGENMCGVADSVAAVFL
ncbi:hypothetical protein QTP70_007658 [Hemibagrus guttatus]|uniref:RING-type domain-containing protein n=1 Tax=Hemibagrus guttatus TaxID=175788 RepID=A0AAE0QWY5_9TELE|nr:hypothetical protein QTP70_007658 [Hemibagrus guttatus]